MAMRITRVYDRVTMLEVVFPSSQDRLLEFAYALGDCAGFVPIVKTRSVILDEAGEDDISRVMSCISRYLSNEKQSSFDLKLNSGKIFVVATSEGSKVWAMSSTGKTGQLPGVLICPHCGKVSTFEAEYRAHLVSHYVLF